MNTSKFYAGLIMFLAFVTPATINAQNKVSFQQAVGMGGFFARDFSGFNFAEYDARLNYAFSRSSSISIHLSPFIGISTNTYGTSTLGDSAWHYYNDDPYVHGAAVGFKTYITYNFGNAATRDSRKHFGGSFGVGYDAFAGSRDVEYYYEYNSNVEAYGPCITARFNFPIGNTSWGLNTVYTFNVDDFNPEVKGVFYCTLFYNINTTIHGKKKNLRYVLR